MRVFRRVLFAVLLVAAAGSMLNATSAFAAGSGKKGCGPDSCLDVYNPVICSNGVVYSNACYARRACATGCVAY